MTDSWSKTVAEPAFRRRSSLDSCYTLPQQSLWVVGFHAFPRVPYRNVLNASCWQLTCLRAYTFTYMHVYMLTCLHAYMLTCLHAYLLACLRTRMLTCLYAWTLAWFMLTCLHASQGGDEPCQRSRWNLPRCQWTIPSHESKWRASHELSVWVHVNV